MGHDHRSRVVRGAGVADYPPRMRIRTRAAGWVAWVVVVLLAATGCGLLSDEPSEADKQQQALTALAAESPEDLVAAVQEALDKAPVLVARTNAADRPLLITSTDEASRFDYTNEDFSISTQMFTAESYCLNDVAAPELVSYYSVSREVKVEDTPWICAEGDQRDGPLVKKLQSYLPTLGSLAGAAVEGGKAWGKPVVEEVNGQRLLHLRGQQPWGEDEWWVTEAWVDAEGRPVRLLQEPPRGRALSWDLTYPADDGGALAQPEGSDRGAYALRTTGDWVWSDGRARD
jgi:hypothetical protein